MILELKLWVHSCLDSIWECGTPFQTAHNACLTCVFQPLLPPLMLTAYLCCGCFIPQTGRSSLLPSPCSQIRKSLPPPFTCFSYKLHQLLSFPWGWLTWFYELGRSWHWLRWCCILLTILLDGLLVFLDARMHVGWEGIFVMNQYVAAQMRNRSPENPF